MFSYYCGLGVVKEKCMFVDAQDNDDDAGSHNTPTLVGFGLLLGHISL